MAKLIISLLLTLVLSTPALALDFVRIDQLTDFTYTYQMTLPSPYNKYPLPVADLAIRVEALKKKYWLEYKDTNDLLETLNIIWEETRFDKHFTMEHVTAIAIKESKLNHVAHNRRDGGKGLMMAMPRYWRKELPWYNDPYNKRQSIRAGVNVLQIFKSEKNRSTWESTRRYNGSCGKTWKYVADIKRIYKDIRITA